MGGALIPVFKLPEFRAAAVEANRRIPLLQRGSVETQQHVATLRKAGLWWASADMTALAVHTADSLPPWTPGVVRPAKTGFMVWSEPVGMAGLEELLPVQAVHWSINHQGHLNLTMFGQSKDGGVWRGMREIGVFTTDAWAAFDPASVQLVDRHAAHIIHVLGCSWLLIQQPTVATTRRAKATGGTSAKRAKKSAESVQVIELRRLATPPRADHTKEPRQVEHTHRWMVRGHWRQQRVGPGRQFVKPVFVTPHVRGPEGLPLKTERVQAWRR
ncbi:hypothetical protein HW450_06695 [Corynebacterium hindlerae]|uniref:Uncharacterized protein n=1 Tax=Corynebacterium hindlerae TaxID=699041 RepID=A0A7G5FBT9_9CORY|nr:hypothetical protein [Corynebacterium hindlerae]QMV84080.1 hypothetical protein HW450_06695 [Corynebacterium hindlerae]